MALLALTRRRMLSALASSPVLATPLMGRASERPPVRLIADDICAVTPETTAGPFYVDPGLVRSDVTEGRPGRALKLAIQVVDGACAPVEGARVDIWHCDAAGVYSGVEDAEGETFMRGTQFADAGGAVLFETIWPGWYPGRATHFHFRVYLGEETALTSQIFLPEDINEAIYAEAPYASRDNARRRLNDDDGIARRAGPGTFARVREVEGEMQAAFVVGIGAAG